MAYTMTVTPEMMTKAAEIATARELERTADALMRAVDVKLKETEKALREGNETVRAVRIEDSDYEKPTFHLVADRLKKLGFDVEVREAEGYMDDSHSLVISF